MACTTVISAALNNSCSAVPIGNVETKGWIINLADLDKSGTVFDLTNPLVISDLVMLGTKVAYPVTVNKTSLGGSFEAVIGTYANKYKHTVNITITEFTNDNKERLDELASSTVCIILENKNKNNATFEIYGYNSGLVLNSMTRNTNENDGVCQLVMASEDGSEDSKMPLSIYKTSYAVTLALLVALES